MVLPYRFKHFYVRICKNIEKWLQYARHLQSQNVRPIEPIFFILKISSAMIDVLNHIKKITWSSLLSIQRLAKCLILPLQVHDCCRASKTYMFTWLSLLSCPPQRSMTCSHAHHGVLTPQWAWHFGVRLLSGRDSSVSWHFLFCFLYKLSFTK